MSFIICDIETAAHSCAADFIDKPDLDAITAPKNFTDPVKIADAIKTRKAEATAAYDADLGTAALDWNLSRIVALGFHIGGAANPGVALIRDEQDEAEQLREFWRHVPGRRIVGFCARTFDVPTLIQRSRLLGVPHPKVNLAPFGRGDVLDVRDELTFDNAKRDYLMPQSLKVFARRFGLDVPDATDGKDIGAMVVAGDWEGIRAHCLADVNLTRELALRINLMPTWKAVAA